MNEHPIQADEAGGCTHGSRCRRHFFNWNGRWVCLECDQLREGGRDPDIPAPAREHAH